MKKIIFVDMDDVLVNYSETIRSKKLQTPQQAYPQAEFGFFMNLEPIDGAIRVMKKMFAHPNIELYIATAPSVKNPLSYTEKRVWVEKYLGMEFVNCLIIIPNKGLLTGDILVDDNCAGKGQNLFKGELWQFGSTSHPDWIAIERNLSKIINYEFNAE